MSIDAKTRVLVVDDHIEMARLLADQLADAGYTVEVSTAAEEAFALAVARPPDVVISDLRMEGLDGLDLLDRIHGLDPSIPVLIMTAFGAIDSAVEAVKRGAYHYLTKPFQLQEVRLYIDRALSERNLRNENRNLRRLVIDTETRNAMVGRSQPLRALHDLVARVAPTTAPVLIRGESGSGKELVARALHFSGPRKDAPFVPVNCTALPEALLESELFGHLRGAFTGATTPRRGLFLEADGGTLYLDEIGDMPHNLQAKLLRVIEDGEIRAVGSDGSRKVDVRIIASTHQPIEERIQNGHFRADLYYRLNVVAINMPPLRDRLDDLPLLIHHFLGRTRDVHPQMRVRDLSPEVFATLARYPWPGNVRELENVIKRLAIVSTQETIDLTELGLHAPGIVDGGSPLEYAKSVTMTLRQLEDEYIGWMIRRCDGNKTKAAELLGVDVSTIHRRDRVTR